MFLICLRALFVLVLGAIGWSLVEEHVGDKGVILVVSIMIALTVIVLDAFIPRKSLSAISGVFFGLVVGLVVAYGLSLIIGLIVETNVNIDASSPFVGATKMAIGAVCCYLAISFILQTKDDVRFIIPYVEFAKQTKGARPMVLDTSVIIDGRIADIADTRILESELIVPRFVLQELQLIADSGDKLKRTRGRRGLDMLNKLQTNEKVDIRILDVRTAKGAAVDELLVDLAVELNGRIVTNDYNLNKVAQFRGVDVININDLANALKPVVLPGETMSVKIVKPGEEVGQGIGYLDDGTMVVAEGGRDQVGETIDLTVTSVLQTSAGRMIFGRAVGAAAQDRERRQHGHRPIPRPEGRFPAP
ncbi:MAG: PIN domain-containing protein [Planctomycetes bacterium]|nr:PIN domain-containing protein [Planctomycetota bacterium]